MEIQIGKRDVAWGYIAIIFNFGTGFFTLPFILSMLSAEEIGMNYLMLTISSLVGLADFGFSQQLGRNLTYTFSGAQSIKKEGVVQSVSSSVNYHLVAVLIKTAKYIYFRLSIIILLIMLTLGTLYIHYVTDGFSNVPNSLFVWILFSISVFFNFYYKYYTTLLTGSSLIMQYNKSCIYSKMVYLAVCIPLLFCGFGLLSVVFANFISPFIQRFYSHLSFFTKEMREPLKNETVSKSEIKEMTITQWYNAKRLGIIFVAQYGINQSGLFLCGLFLSLADIAAYGLLMQLSSAILCSVSKSLFNSVSPLFAKDVVQKNKDALLRHFSLGNFVFLSVFVAGSLIIIFAAPWVLRVIHSNSNLPSVLVMSVFLIDALLDYNHSNFNYIFMAENSYPFMKADIFTGISVVIINFITLYFTDWGLLGVVAGRLLCQLTYNDWKWPLAASRKMGIPLWRFAMVGYDETLYKVKNLLAINKRKIS